MVAASPSNLLGLVPHVDGLSGTGGMRPGPWSSKHITCMKMSLLGWWHQALICVQRPHWLMRSPVQLEALCSHIFPIMAFSMGLPDFSCNIEYQTHLDLQMFHKINQLLPN